jgi:hypothetical protein|nr:MAG TPA: hypothetical protein [Caudoviricetes sp.]
MTQKEKEKILHEYIRKKLFTFNCEELKENKIKYKGEDEK